MRCVVLVLALAACADPSLRVKLDFERPPIDRIVVSVYESPSITCEQIEYADLNESQLAALLVDEQSIDGDTVEGTLDNLSRTDHKLIVARGYSQTGELLEGGCAPHDLIVENDSVLVKTHVIASVSAEPFMSAPGVISDPLRIGVLVTDREGVVIDDRPVSWRMIGPAGSDEIQSTNITPTGDGTWQPTEPACTNGNGTTPIYPVTPNVVGGFATSVRVAWANQVVTQFSGVTNTDFALTDLVIPEETKHPCAVSIRSSGGVVTKRLVCVDRVATQMVARQFPVTVSMGVATLGTPMTTNLPRQAIGLFALPTQADPAQREVYALDRDGQLTPLFGAAAPLATTNCPECPDNVVDAMVAPACGERDPAKMLFVVRRMNEPDKVKVIPARGGVANDVGVAPDSMLEINLANAGCATTIGPGGYEERQLSVLDIKTAAGSFTRGFYGCSPICKRVVLPVPESAIGFTKTSPPYLIGTATDPSGIVLATWGLIPDPDDLLTDRLVERAPRVPAASTPSRLAVGTFDEDEGADMIFDLSLRGRAGGTIELAYSNAAGVRLQALSSPLPFTILDLIAQDVDNDTHDDIIIVVRKVLDQGGVVVVPTHAIARPKMIPVETSCGGS